MRLRLLATSDLHMQMMAFDYVKDCPNNGGSLAKIATLIEAERAQAAREDTPCLLFDNGDTFQGTPVGDFLTRSAEDAPHPMVECMNHLRYDAGGLGNHDFDHGLEKLALYLNQHKMPVICSNLQAPSLPMIKDSTIIKCPVSPNGKNPGSIYIGVLSTLPRKTALWSRHHVEERAEFGPPLPVLQKKARALRAKGADLIVVLAHMGLALFDEGDDPQNQISDVAALEDIDVVIGGHTHLRFPGPDHQRIPEADCMAGTVYGKPVVQPGASATDLGVMDLTLRRTQSAAAWKVGAAKVTLRSVDKFTPEHPDILNCASSVHAKTRKFLSRPVARLEKPINSFFALAQPSPVPALLAQAKRRLIKQTVAGMDCAHLPLVAVASTPLTGGFDGPENFLNLKSGQINGQHVAGMNPYANHVWAVKTTGAQLRDWLERSALIFNTLVPNMPDQLLIDPRVPGFRYDAIYGLEYQIDPRNPPLFDMTGRQVADRDGRIRDIRWHGKPMEDRQEFLVATTDHRAGGGGVYKTFGNSEIVVQGHSPLQDAVLDLLGAPPTSTSMECAHPWSFVPDMDRTAILLSAPEAIEHLDEIAHLRPEPCGQTKDGFLRLRLHL